LVSSRKVIASFLPFCPFHFIRALGSSNPTSARSCLQKQVSPFLFFDATSASPTQTDCFLGLACCRRSAFPASTSLELYHPSAYSDLGAHFCTSPFGKASKSRCFDFWKSRTQGLATLSAELATQFLRNLFQFLTLLGFALQSFSPSL
jgi:hypothetical protein